jgi:large subunit ribosomal protein L4
LEIVEESKLSSHKTKTFWEMAERRGWLKGTGTLIVTDSPQDRNLRLAASNIEKIDLISELGLNVYSILSRDKLVITRNALEALQARLVEDLDEKPIRVQLDVSL